MEIGKHSAYLRGVMEPKVLSKTVSNINKKLKELVAEGLVFDFVAFRGQSGAGVAYPLACRHGWKIACVRKSAEGHHGTIVEASRGDIHTYLIVDDLIASGDTVNAINEALRGAQCVGIVLYYSVGPREYFDDIPIYYP